MSVCVNYWSVLPEEIITKILSYLKMYDVMQICRAYPPISHILCDSQIVQSINFSKEYRLSVLDLEIFSNSIKCEEFDKIIHLNINNVYWIGIKELHKFISKLICLKSLLAMDTKLGLTIDDCHLYKQCPKLEVLALTLRSQDIGDNLRLITPTLKYFYLRINDSNYYGFDITYNLEAFRNKNLQRLWIFDEHLYFPKAFILVDPKNPEDKIFRTFYLSRNDFPMVFLETNILWKQFLEKFNGPTKKLWTEENARLMQFLPFGMNDIKHLCKKECNLETIHFEELNFCHAPSVCIYKLQHFIYEVLVSPRGKYLKKLAINICICKKKTFIKSSFGDIIENCQFLEELEISDCAQVRDPTMIGFKLISKLEKLKKLTFIDVPLHLYATFLPLLIKNCTNLEFLSVRTSAEFEMLALEDSMVNEYLYTSLRYITSLRDFRLEQEFLSLRKIFYSLNKLPTSHIQRVFIKCTAVEDFDVDMIENLKEFLHGNPNLVFFMITIKKLTSENHKIIQDTMNLYKCTPEKIFFVTADERKYTGDFPIPAIHKYDLMACTTKVSVYNFFENCHVF